MRLLGNGEVLDCRDQVPDHGIVCVEMVLQFVNLSGQPTVCGQHCSQSHEGPPHKHAHLHRPPGVEDSRCHDRPMLGEGVRKISRPPLPLFEVTNCDLKTLCSLFVSWNMKSGGKRSRLRFICWLKCLTLTPYSSAKCTSSMTL